jgi:hypothetical protein
MADDGSKNKDTSFKGAFEENRSAISGIFHTVNSACNNAGTAILRKVGLEGVAKYVESIASSPREKTIMETEANILAAGLTAAEYKARPDLMAKAMTETVRDYVAPSAPGSPKI